MAHVSIYSVCILLYLHGFVASCLSLGHKNIIESKVLNVGEELLKRNVAVTNGLSLLPIMWTQSIHVYALTPSMEVDYGISTVDTASFSIQMKTDKSNIALNAIRRLLNTEKLIFEAESQNLLGHSEVHVLVTVEPAGIVANPHLQERQSVIFNIVCDELSLGIPHKAWWVGILAFLCLGLALVVPYFLPPDFLPKKRAHDQPTRIF